jgi:hypothetical protein
MTLITAAYMVNAMLLLLHEMESAYEREWEILKLPGKITGFLVLHIPIILLIFFGLIEIEKQSSVGWIIGVILGISGVIPFIVHKIAVRKEFHFNRPMSDIIIYLNIVSGCGLVWLISACP